VTDAPHPRPPIDQRRLAVPADWVVDVVDETPSTNLVVAERARRGAGEGLVVVAEHQTAGRGRLDRTWETPARSALTLSLLLRPTVPAADWPWVPLLAGYAAAVALRRLGAPVEVKWPNDLLLEDRKLGGILVERIETTSGPAVVVGIGLNVSMTGAELPVPGAASLAVAGLEVDRTDLLAALLQAVRTEYDGFQRGGTQPLRAAYESVCASLGRDVVVELPTGQVLRGAAVGIDEGGRLQVRTPEGVVEVSAGDVVHATLAG
jgi:BirA family biotin operon repressor/biotin-[acetyl-CoA-carboxylase] ligase